MGQNNDHILCNFYCSRQVLKEARDVDILDVISLFLPGGFGVCGREHFFSQTSCHQHISPFLQTQLLSNQGNSFLMVLWHITVFLIFGHISDLLIELDDLYGFATQNLIRKPFLMVSLHITVFKGVEFLVIFRELIFCGPLTNMRVSIACLEELYQGFICKCHSQRRMYEDSILFLFREQLRLL